MTGGTGPIFLAGILDENEHARNINTATNTNNEIVKVEDVIESYSESDFCST